MDQDQSDSTGKATLVCGIVLVGSIVILVVQAKFNLPDIWSGGIKFVCGCSCAFASVLTLLGVITLGVGSINGHSKEMTDNHRKRRR